MNLRWFRVMIAIIGLALFSSLAIPAVAATPAVDLVLGGSGAIPWTIGNIAPGSSGTQTVTLNNAGSQNGVVTIWISNIVNSEGANPESETGNTSEPGELGNYLTLNVSGPNLNTNFTMPATINNLPQSAADARHIYVDPLNAGSTVTLQWNWQLPPQTGNDVMGDGLSFTINYTLEESPPTPSGGGGGGGTNPGDDNITGFVPQPPRSLPFVSTEGVITFDILSDGSTANTYVAAFFENTLTLQFDSNTVMTLSNGAQPERMDVSLAQTGPPPGEGRVIVSPIYQISANYDANGNYQGVNIDRPVTIILRYDPGAVPQNVTSLYIATFEGNPNQPQRDWVRLDPSPNFIPEPGKISGLLNHFSFFAVMADLAPSTPVPQTPVPPQTAPANFEVRNLTISPAEAKPGESISITCDVVNTGGQSGEYTLLINIPGLLQTSQLIKLEAGKIQAVSLTLPPGAPPGTYQVDIGGVKGSFTIGPLTPAPPGIQKTVKTWLILTIILAIAVVGLVYYALFVWMRRRKYNKSHHTGRML